MGKVPPANTAAPQAASLLGSPTTKLKKPGPQPAQDARLSQAAPPAQAEDTSDSSSSSDSDEETPKQPPKPGQFSQENALSAASQARVGTAFCYPVRGVTFTLRLERGSSSPAGQSAPLSLETECPLAVAVLGR